MYKNIKKRNAKALQYYYNNRTERRQRHKQYSVEKKIEALTHYGKDGRLQCSWSNCEITDIDLLTLDHVNNDGSAHRKICPSGGSIYPWVCSHNFPEGFQTLCWNHQWKKELMRRRNAVE